MSHPEVASKAELAVLAPDSVRASTPTQQYLSFMLGGEEYATDILRVQEIKGWDTVTRVPYAPDYVLGVINLRGAIVPVIDLRVRFGLECAAFDSATVIIVVHVAAERGERIVGVVVDAVSDVYNFASESIQPPPDVLGPVDNMFVTGLANLDGKLVILLNIERLVITSVVGETKATN
jgi:purine-binding chemotaxis protein CheW